MKSKSNVLIIDDNKTNVKLIEEILKERALNVFKAYDSEEAFNILNETPIDLILLDIKLENVNSTTDYEATDGYKVISKIKSINKTNNIPVIFLTSLADPRDKVKAFQAGAVDFITKPFNSMELVARIETHIKLKKMSDEIFEYTIDLEKLVAEKTQQIKQYADNLQKMVEEKVGIIKVQNEQMLKDLESAQRMQSSILAKKFPNVKNIETDVHYHPCKKVGGDFYDVFNLDEHHIGFYIADVSGHGISASMVTFFVVELLNHLKKTIYQDGKYKLTSPTEIMDKVNQKILKEDFDGLYVTLFYAILNTTNGELTWSNAGHHAYPLIYRNETKKVEILKSKSMALGWFDYAHYTENKNILKPKDKVLLYTDGIIDSKNSEGELYGIYKLANLLETIGEKPTSTLSFRLLKEIRKYQRSNELEDDLTFLAIQLKKLNT